MIIKIMPVKTMRGIGKVADYIATDKGRSKDRMGNIFHNLVSTELDGIVKEFTSNYTKYAKKKIDGNKAVHVVLSVSPADREKMTRDIMDDIVGTYLEKAYPNALAYGNHHMHDKHYHTHLLVSPNDLMSERSTRFSLRELKKIHLEMVQYIREAHPELSTHIDVKNWGRKLNNSKEYFKERRASLKQTKHELSGRIFELFRAAPNSKQFYDDLRSAGYRTYNHKDKVQGVYYGDGQKMRFSRLGLEHKQIEELDMQHEELKEVELENERMQELDEIRNSKETELGLDNDTDFERSLDDDFEMEIGA